MKLKLKKHILFNNRFDDDESAYSDIGKDIIKMAALALSFILVGIILVGIAKISLDKRVDDKLSESINVGQPSITLPAVTVTTIPIVETGDNIYYKKITDTRNGFFCYNTYFFNYYTVQSVSDEVIKIPQEDTEIFYYKDTDDTPHLDTYTEDGHKSYRIYVPFGSE